MAKSTLHADSRRPTDASRRSRRTSATTCSTDHATNPAFGATAGRRGDLVPRAASPSERRWTRQCTGVRAEHQLNKKMPINRHSTAPRSSVVQPGTGNILAMAQNRTGARQGQPVHDLQLQRRPATQDATAAVSYNGVGIQTGSTFKPFVLAAALEGQHPGQHSSSMHRRRTCQHGLQGLRTGTTPPRTPTIVQRRGRRRDVRHAHRHRDSVNTYFVQLEKQTGLCGPTQIASAMGVHAARRRQVAGAACRPMHSRRQLGRTAAHGRGVRDVRRARHALHRRARSCDHDAERHAMQGAAAELQAGDRRRAIADGVTRSSRASSTEHHGPHRSALMPRSTGCGQDRHDRRAHVNVWFCGYTPQLAAAVWVGDPTRLASCSKSVHAQRHDRQDALHRRSAPTCPGRSGRRSWTRMCQGPAGRSSSPRSTRRSIRGFTMKVPDVTGLTAAKALKALTDAGFTAACWPASRSTRSAAGHRGPHRARRAAAYVGSGIDGHRVRQQRQSSPPCPTLDARRRRLPPRGLAASPVDAVARR